MKKLLFISTLLIAALISTPATSGHASDALGICLVDSLTGKERKQLAKWIFFAMSAHPEIAEFSKITVESRNENDQLVGNLITRLLADDCPSEAKLAVNNESSIAIKSAFELVGRVAMQELMTNKNVATSISGLEKIYG